MKKPIVLTIAIILVVAIIAVACILIFNRDISNTENPTNPSVNTNITEPDIDDFTIPPIPEPTNPEEILNESFILAKEALGDEYYPSVTMSEDEIVEMFGISPDDYTLAFGQKCDDGHLDMLVSIKAKDIDASERIQQAIYDYNNALIADTDTYPDYVIAALKGALVLYDTSWGYVYFAATFGDIESIADMNAEEITAYAEENCSKVLDAIAMPNNK